MVTRTFLDKCTTIINGSKDNFGLNPIGMLNYGQVVSRCLVHFDLENIENGGFTADSGVKHILKLTNCAAIGKDSFNTEDAPSSFLFERERATSFDVIAFRIPEFWDAGRGFDSSDDFWFIGKKAVSQHGANWYYAYDGKEWGTEIDDSGHTIPVEGVLSNKTLEEEYEKYLHGEDSMIIGQQHFDRGNENFAIDITKYVNSVLRGEYKNNGIGLAFSPLYESLSTEKIQYVGFFTNHTNTFFAPVVESRCFESIQDDRYRFFAGKENKLYFKADLDGVYVDLDELPTCTIEGVIYPVKRQTTGVYYAEVKLNPEDVSENSILEDIWGNLKYNGVSYPDELLEFVVLPNENFLSFGGFSKNEENLEPSISGINDSEKLYQGDERILNVSFKIKYSSQYELANNCQYRIYVKDGNREYDVIDWDSINTEGKFNTFKIKSAELLPNEYHVDIRAKIGRTTRVFKNKLTFRIVDNVTNQIH